MMEGSVCAPWDDCFCWRKNRLPELAVLNRVVSPLVGTHDFSAFAAAGDPSKSKVRTIYSAVFTVEGSRVVFKIAGNAFLWKMVRSVLGTAIQIAETGGSSEEMRYILIGKQRADAGTTAPARGLFLERVLYNERAVI
jgi:tRNA pseudouridine38-40 synthase